MSSITVGDLKKYLDDYPDDYEVIMEIRSKTKDGKKEEFIAYINGIKQDELFREVRLLN